jgi:hypothetical protein
LRIARGRQKRRGKTCGGGGVGKRQFLREKVVPSSSGIVGDTATMIGAMRGVEMNVCSMSKKHHQRIIVPVRVAKSNNTTPKTVMAMIDSGATHSFVDLQTAKTFALNAKRLQEPKRLARFERKEAEPVTHHIHENIEIAGHNTNIELFVTKLKDKYNMIIGMDWLGNKNLQINWKLQTVEWGKVEVIDCQVACSKEVATQSKSPPVYAYPGDITFENPATSHTCESCNSPLCDRDAKINRKIEATTWNLARLAADQVSNTIRALEELVQPRHHKWVHLFCKQDAKRLPPHQLYDF